MKNIINQQMKNLEEKERRLLNQKKSSLMKSTITPILDQIQRIIPPKLKSTLDMAFFKGFQLVFDKGSPLIEKTYNKDKIELDFDINDYAVDKRMNKRHLNRLDKQSVQSKVLNTSFSVIEGGVLGLLGIGLPDIPLFLSVVVKTIYEVALSYGFRYETKEEKSYVLLLICGAMTKEQEQKEFDKQLEELGDAIDSSVNSNVNFEDTMRLTSEVFSEALLTIKFIQGIPIVGAVGGIVNYTILNKISNYARVKYKKRYLQKKVTD